MSTINPVEQELPSTSLGQKCWQVTWGPMANGDVGAPVDLVEYTDRSVQVEGTFGTGGNAEIQGSNDLSNFRPLRDPSSTLLDLTAAGIHGILEFTGQIRPKITAGDDTTSLTVTLVLRRTWK
jgi:hypothetical protein